MKFAVVVFPGSNCDHDAYYAVKDVRQGKFFEVELDAVDPAAAKARVTEMADKLLANPVIESYRVEVL